MTELKGPELALIALGANLGDPAAALQVARSQIAALGRVTATSWLYRTAPVGGPPGQPDYLNAALSLHTPLEPLPLLHALLDIERRGGRVRLERWGPRLLDLDLIGYGGRVLTSPELTLPHPHAFERGFVLAPLADVAPHWRHPHGGETAAAALRRVGTQGLERLEARL